MDSNWVNHLSPVVINNPSKVVVFIVYGVSTIGDGTPSPFTLVSFFPIWSIGEA